MTLRNLPENVGKDFASLIEVKPCQIVSMNLTRSDHVQMTLFSFSKGESVSEEMYPGDAMYLVVEGQALIAIDGKKFFLNAGQVLKVGKEILHEISAEEDLKILQTIVFD